MAEDNLQTLGAMLRQARESQALSLEEVEAQTRIRVKYLQALETGDFSVLPSITHARGFLRNYAQFLHLDANSIVADFGDMTGSSGGAVTTVTAGRVFEAPPPPSTAAPIAYPSQPPIPDESVPQAPPPPPLPPRPVYIAPDQQVGPSRPRSMGAAESTPPPMPRAQGGLVPPRSTEVLEPPARQSSLGNILRSGLLTGAILLIGFAVIIWAVTTQISKISVEDVVPTSENPAFFQTFEARTEATASPTFVPTDTPLPDSGVQILDRVLLTITVEQRAWTTIIVDGQTQYEGQAEPGTLLQFDGAEQILVRTGNGAGLIVTYNGQDIGPMGGRGEIVERIFTVGGQITPTPTPTITPTSTFVPTSTPNS